MILNLFGVLQVILIQVISAQLSNRDQASQNVLNYLVNMPLAGYGRSRRQIDNPLVGSSGSGDLPVHDFANSLPLRNGMPFGNLPRGNGLTNNFGLNNGLPNSFGLNNGMALPSNSPFPKMNITPQNRLLPNINGINNNGLPFNIPSELPTFNNAPNALPNRLPSFNNVPNGLPSFNNAPNALPNRLPSFNNVPNGLTSFNNAPNALPNRLPSFNNVPSGLPSFNNAPNALPNRLPSFNNVPSGLPSLNNVPSGLPSLNNVPSGLPSFNNAPNALPNFNNVPNGLPSFNNVPNGLPCFNNLSCGNALQPLPLSNGWPLNYLPSGNLLPPINNQLPYLNNFRINEIGIGHGIAEINRFPRNDLSVDNMLPNVNNLQSGNELTQVPGELSIINNHQNNNGFSGFTNTPPASVLPNNVPGDDRFSSINNFSIDNRASNIASVAQNINNMQSNNGLQDFQNFNEHNVMPVNEQSFVNNAPFNIGLADANYFPAHAAMPSSNSRLINSINNGMPHSNKGYLNEFLFANNRQERETCSKNSNGYGFSSNDFQFGNVQVPVNNWHYDSVGAKMKTNQNTLPEEVQICSNVPSDCQSVLMPNNLNLAQELIKNLKIEGSNMPFLNGLPLAGITETVTMLNVPCSK